MNLDRDDPHTSDDHGHGEMLRRQLVEVATHELAELPLPGGGDTRGRFAALAAVGARDLSLARLAEAHTDALAILAEAGHQPPPGAIFGVWAARSRDEVVTATPVGDGWHLAGRKPWSSGWGILSHALVTAESPNGPALLLVDLARAGVQLGAAPWAAPAFAATGTVTTEFDLTVPHEAQVGPSGWYLERPGFWHGAAGVAACWAGGVTGLVDRAAPWWRRDPHAAAHRAATEAAAWAADRLVAATADELDAAPTDVGLGKRAALRLRHLVDATVDETLTRTRRACGPAPFAHDADLVRHAAELELYVRQCHAERDLEVAAGA